jgi:hypothetical protein
LFFAARGIAQGKRIYIFLQWIDERGAAVAFARFLGGSSGLQATEKQAKKRGALAPGLLLAAATMPTPEGGLIFYLGFRGLKPPAPSKCRASIESQSKMIHAAKLKL